MGFKATKRKRKTELKKVITTRNEIIFDFGKAIIVDEDSLNHHILYMYSIIYDGNEAYLDGSYMYIFE